MIIWTLKLISTARRAIAGRKYPHQLAWAVAFGLLLGIVPHGNLLALGLLLLVLSLKLNHAMAGLTAIGASFGATLLDPYSHRIGDAVLTDPNLSQAAAKAWQLPLVPWTDLNNTVVMGSFLIGVAALVPIFLVTYPIFRLIAPAVQPEPSDDNQNEATANQRPQDGHDIIVVEPAHDSVAKRHRTPQPAAKQDDQVIEILPSWEITDPETASADAASDDLASHAVTRKENSNHENSDHEDSDHDAVRRGDVAVETRIDVIRMKDYREAPSAAAPADRQDAESTEQQQQPMDEALSYLLRQLRDSQQRKVA